MANPPGGNLFNLLASLQHVDNLRAQSTTAQSLAEQLQRLGAAQHAQQAHSRDRELLEVQRAALAKVLAQTQQQLAQQAQQAAEQVQSYQAPGQLPPPRTPGPQGPAAMALAAAAFSASSASASSTAPGSPVQVGPPLGGHSGLAGLAGLVGFGGSAGSGSGSQPRGLAPPGPVQHAAPKAAARKEPEEPEVPRCHLHKKQNKACKFCKVFYAKEEEKQAKLAEERNAAIEKLREGNASSFSSRLLGPDDKAPLPNLPLFPQVWLDRISKNDYFLGTMSQMTSQEVKGIIAKAEACDTEWRAEKALDLEPRPSAFISAVYRLMQLQLTEAELRNCVKNRSPFVRCAGFLYVRMGMHHERYWDLFSDCLMDDEEFVPFPNKGAEPMSVGVFAEGLLTKDKYLDLSLPRIPVAHRKVINKRMVLFGQFRRRYAANLEVLERFKEAGVKVEICTEDGEWIPGETTEVPSKGPFCRTVKVKLSAGEERDVSLGMVICPSKDKDRDSRDRDRDRDSDLTRSRGRSAEELLEKYEAQVREAAVASGKDYCKGSGQHTMRVGGVPFVAGVKRKDMDSYMPMMEDEDSRRVAIDKRELEHKAKQAAIESKYCARVGSGRSDRSNHNDGPDRMRLG